MTAAELVPLLLKTSIAALVLSLGLTTDRTELTHLLRRPGQLVRSLLSMNLIFPFLAVGLAVLFRLSHVVEVTLIALSLSPVPPILPRKQTKAGGNEGYAVSLLVCAAVASIVTIPLAVEVIQHLVGRPLEMSALAVAKIVFATVLAPLAGGMLIHALAPRFAADLAKPLSTLATVVLLLGLIAILVAAWPQIVAQTGDGTILAVVVLVAAGLAVGWLLGGPAPADRTVLALSTASRHPGVAVAIVTANFPREPGVMAVVLLVLLVTAAVSGVWLAVRKRRAKA